jgi:hypothetical protein
MTSFLYLFVFGKTLFLPKEVIKASDDKLIIYRRSHHEEIIQLIDIVDIMAVKNSQMSFMRLSHSSRSYGKLTLKTMQKTYELYPIANVDETKKKLEHLWSEFKKRDL